MDFAIGYGEGLALVEGLVELGGAVGEESVL